MQKQTFAHVIRVPVVSNDGVLCVYDVQAINQAIKDIHKPSEQLVVICFDEGNTQVASEVRQYWGLGGTPPHIMQLFRDKILMKQKLQECGVRVPIFMGIDKCVSFDSLAQSLGLPMIIKPINSAGTNSVFVVSTAQGYQDTINLINNKAEEYQAEEFIDGTLYHCDIALVQNRVVFAQCTRYLASTIQFQNGVPLGGQFIENDEAIHSQLVSFTILSISSLGAEDGVFHTEIFEKIDGTLVFLESGHRPAGMLVNRMYELATGVNLLNIDIRIQAQIPLNDFAQAQKLSQAFYLMYPKRTGLVDGINELMIPNEVVASYHCIAKTGDVHSGCHSNLDYIASVVSSGKGEVFEKFYERMANFQPVIYKQ